MLLTVPWPASFASTFSRLFTSAIRARQIWGWLAVAAEIQVLWRVQRRQQGDGKEQY